MRKWHIYTVIILLVMISVSSTAWAEVRTFTTEGEYVMGTGETMAVAEERAMKKAAQSAAEQAGAFVKSYSKVQNLTLAEDVVEVVANHAMKVTVLDKKKSVVGDLDAIKFWVRIKAVTTSEDIEANLKKVQEDRGVIDTYNRLKADYDRQGREMEILKKRLAESGDEEKKRVLAEITNKEKRFKANLWLERAGELWPRDETAIKAYDKAIELNPTLIDAYVGRARILSDMSVRACYALLDKGQFQCPEEQVDQQKALSDLNRAIAMDGNHAEAYACRAWVYRNIRDIEWRIAYGKKMDLKVLDEIQGSYTPKMFADINQAIALKPNYHQFYDQRSRYYDPLNDMDKAIADVTRAITICQEADCGRRLYIYYKSREALYSQAGQKKLAEKDKTEAEKIFVGKQKDAKGDVNLMQKSNLATLQKEIYGEVSTMMDEKKKEQTLKVLNQKISRKKGTAEDYILRADLGNSQNSQIRDYSEAIRLLRAGRPEGKDALLLTRAYLFKALLYISEKKHDPALKELQEAQQVVDQRLPRAMDFLKDEDYAAIMAGSQEKALKLNRNEAIAFFWRTLAAEIATNRGAIYEEMSLPAKAKAEYQFLCEKLKDEKACKNLERLQ